MCQMIKFSFIMAAYNAEKYINEAIKSVLKQTYENWELVIVNDGSTDCTGDIIEEYAQSDPRIKVIHQKNSGTAAAARNTALKYITGDYIQMLDADDLVKEDLLYTYNQKLQEYEFDILVPNCICFENNNLEEIFWEKYPPGREYGQVLDGQTGFKLSLDWTIHGVFLVKAEIISKIKYEPTLVNGDELTTRKVLFNAEKIGFVKSFYYYRRNLKSTTKNEKNKYRMYESVLTDINIYNYAVQCDMTPEIINMCSCLLVRSFCGHCRMFYKEHNHESEERKYAGSILLKTFNFITRDMWRQAPIKYKFFYYLSGGKYNHFMNEMKIISKL